MDIGIFKASQVRLIAWIIIPPVLIVGVGLSTYALKRQSEWKLSNTRELSEVLPKLIQTQEEAGALIKKIQGVEADSLKNEDELISFLQGAAQKAGFMIDSLKVERSTAAQNSGIPVLTARVKGAGAFTEITSYIGDVTTAQVFLSESSLKVTRSSNAYNKESWNADVTFELILFDSLGASGGLL